MCRLIGYLGKEITLDNLILKPKHSLYVQSWQPKELRYAKLNADGFGFGWYDETHTALLYRNQMPIWTDINLKTLASVLTSSLWLAMVRSATENYISSPLNIQPFQYKQYLFVHNGFIEQFNTQILQKIIAEIEPVFRQNIHGMTDSEYLFALVCHFISETNDLDNALVKTAHWLEKNLEHTKAMLNIIISDGKSLSAIRFALNELAPSLYLNHKEAGFPINSYIVASERFSDTEYWQEISASSLVSIQPDEPAVITSL